LFFISVADVAKAAGVEWGKLSASEKSVWEKKVFIVFGKLGGGGNLDSLENFQFFKGCWWQEAVWGWYGGLSFATRQM